MSRQPSRREIIGVAAAGLAGLAVPSAASAQTGHDIGVTVPELDLAKPLSPEANTLLSASLKDLEKAAKERLKTKLPENSEPCFGYAASPREVRRR